eukprot:TRINITY_DN2113_c0_g1_i2.p1 TRINITY_DN2113_c0_g1~~TRINITY_DN2113_c0_g1_i2.p1  ORF type:complete len:318 (-),score=64.64 TRINITY_DN2113_c0_g1_i2:260-1213(-)
MSTAERLAPLGERWAVDYAAQIGSGSYGKVVKGYDLYNDNMPVAVKVVSKARLSRSAAADLRREAEMMKRMNHPNIMQLLDSYEDQNHIYLIMELFETDLLCFVQKRGVFCETAAKAVFRQLVDAICYMHKNNMVHGDLKLENILYDPDTGRVCLIDFGFSKMAQPGLPTATNVTASPGYVAPEIMKKSDNENYDPFPGDVYSLGVILYSMVYGLFPFLDVIQGKSYYQEGAQHPTGQSTLFVGGKYAGPRRPSLNFPENASFQLQKLLHQVLCKNQKERVSVQELIEHPWLQDSLTKQKQPLRSLVRGFFRTRVQP